MKLTRSTARRFQQPAISRRRKEPATTLRRRWPAKLLWLPVRRLIAALLGGTTFGWWSSWSGADPTGKIRQPSSQLRLLLLMILLLLLRDLDAQTNSDPEFSRRFVVSGSNSNRNSTSCGESSSTCSSSGSSNLGALYYFSEEEREERILQALERIANLVATSTAYSDEEEEEDISNAAATATIRHGVDKVQKVDPGTDGTVVLPIQNENNIAYESTGVGSANLYHPQRIQGHQPGREAIFIGEPTSLQVGQPQGSLETQKDHHRTETPLQFLGALSPAVHHSLKNRTASPTIVGPHSVGTSAASVAASVVRHDLPQSDPQIKAHQKRAKGTTDIAPPANAQPNTGSTPGNIGASITTPWVRHFLSSCPSDVLLPVPKDYCSDNFNLSLLPPIIERIANSTPSSISAASASGTGSSTTKPFPFYRQALRLLLQDAPVPPHIPEPVQRAVTALYLLLHQRYALSPRGLDLLRRRFLLTTTRTPEGRTMCTVDPLFGRCPSMECHGRPLLPIGDSDEYPSSDGSTVLSEDAATTTQHNDNNTLDSLVQAANHRAKRYCAGCRRVFYHWDSQVYGCAWGKSFCHLFLLVHGEEVFAEWNNEHRQRLHNHSHWDDPSTRHVPTIFGFRLHPSASQ